MVPYWRTIPPPLTPPFMQSWHKRPSSTAKHSTTTAINPEDTQARGASPRRDVLATLLHCDSTSNHGSACPCSPAPRVTDRSLVSQRIGLIRCTVGSFLRSMLLLHTHTHTHTPPIMPKASCGQRQPSAPPRPPASHTTTHTHSAPRLRQPTAAAAPPPCTSPGSATDSQSR